MGIQIFFSVKGGFISSRPDRVDRGSNHEIVGVFCGFGESGRSTNG